MIVNVLLKFQMLKYYKYIDKSLEKCENQKILTFFSTKNNSVFEYIIIKDLK